MIRIKRGIKVVVVNEGEQAAEQTNEYALDYHSTPLDQLFGKLKTSEKGLSSEEAKKRLSYFGYNELKEAKRISPAKIFLSQFKSLIVWILIAAVLISMFLEEFVESTVILAIIFLNALIGFMQEYKAEKAIDALKKLVGLRADVLRNGERRQIDAKLLVPGDVVLLATGDQVPADCRLLEEVNLELQESVLTGESVPVRKQLCIVEKAAQLAERKNMAFLGTIVTKGRAKAVVVKTGMQTEVGRIARLIQETEEEPTPLQKQFDRFGKRIGYATIAISAIVFAVMVAREGTDVSGLLELFKVSVSLAVAAIPEGLPAIVTLTLALGVQKMARRHVLVRKLASAETLGSTTVICTDKTGTLTLNQMTVVKLYVNGEELECSTAAADESIKLLLRIGALCNDASLTQTGRTGDPTEAALLVSAAKAGIDINKTSEEFARIGEVPFDPVRKRMSTAHLVRGKIGREVLYTKGAPDIVLRLCSHVYLNGKVVQLTKNLRKKILLANEKFAAQTLRVLGFAYKQLRLKRGKQACEGLEKEENDLIFVGLQAMTDPPRPEAREAIALCKKAGIKVVMITGDHEATAEAIAKQLGLEGAVITGEELDKLTDEELQRAADEATVYARVTPEHKLRIISALEKTGKIAAMTGDGVNDAPAMKKADIGIAMGITGTDVAREASQMVLTDDNFASIVNAVEEGRGIYENIKKFVFFLLSSNVAEVLVIFLAAVIGLPLPIAAIQLLWINLITDGLPALALGLEPAPKDIMQRKLPRLEEGILTKDMLTRILITSFVITLGTLAVFYYKLTSAGYSVAMTAAFTTIVMFELFNSLAAKSEKKQIISKELFNNKHLLLAILSSVLLQLAVIYLPFNNAFNTAKLSLADLGLVLAVASTLILVDTVYKLVKKIANTSQSPQSLPQPSQRSEGSDPQACKAESRYQSQ